MKHGSKQGFYLLEFVTVLIVFLPILLGVIDLYHLFRVRGAVWETAHKMTDIYRRVGQNPNTPGAPNSRFDQTLTDGALEFSGALPYVILNCANPSDRYCLNFAVVPTPSDVSVSVEYRLPVMVIGYLFGSPVISLTATSTRRIEESFLAQDTPAFNHL